MTDTTSSGMEPQGLHGGEAVALGRWSGALIGYLLLVAFACAVGVAGLLVPGLLADELIGGLRPVVSTILAGTMGSAVSALVSLLDRRSAGWEFDDGDKWPPSGKSREDDRRAMFGMRMAPWFMVRPWFGTVMGVVFYAGLAAGYLLTTRSTLLTDPHAVAGLAFFGFLVGLMAKTFLGRLRDAFEALFGTGS